MTNSWLGLLFYLSGDVVIVSCFNSRLSAVQRAESGSCQEGCRPKMSVSILFRCKMRQYCADLFPRWLVIFKQNMLRG